MYYLLLGGWQTADEQLDGVGVGLFEQAALAAVFAHVGIVVELLVVVLFAQVGGGGVVAAVVDDDVVGYAHKPG